MIDPMSVDGLNPEAIELVAYVFFVMWGFVFFHFVSLWARAKLKDVAVFDAKWLLISALLAFLLTIPGFALFQLIQYLIYF